MAVRIDYLGDHPEYIPTIARWHQLQWGYLDPDRTLEDRIAELRTHLAPRSIPTTFVAVDEEMPVGCVSLIPHDLDTQPPLTPWLASLYVAPRHRRRGVGSALVQRVVEEARLLDIATLYLFTPDQDRFYARRGWAVLHRDVL